MTEPEPIQAAKYFQALASRFWSDAERELTELKKTTPKGDWARGYMKCLEGLLLSLKSNDDKYLYLPKALADPDNPDLEKLAKEFQEFSSFPMRADYDKGFFEALSEYILVHNKLQKQFGRQAKSKETSESPPLAEAEVAAVQDNK